MSAQEASAPPPPAPDIIVTPTDGPRVEPHIQAWLRPLTGWVLCAAVLVVMPLVLPQISTLQAGFVVAFGVGALGLHILVNWTGEVSLAQAAFVGLPALIVTRWSGSFDISPVVLLPVAMAIGCLFGFVVGLPSLRVRGLYVTIVTLCIAIAVDQYEFVQPWVTNQPLQTAAPKLGGLDFSSIDASYGLSTAVFLVVLAVCIALYKSKFYRSASLVRTDPRLAATLGVNARNTRLIAYSVTGALAGLSGGLTAVIVQGASPTSFPLTLSFEFLTVVVLAGPGSLLGVVIAIVGIDGVNQFVATNNVVWLFLTPVLLIIAVTRYPEGLNGHLNHLGRSLATLASRVWHQRGRERQGL